MPDLEQELELGPAHEQRELIGRLPRAVVAT